MLSTSTTTTFMMPGPSGSKRKADEDVNPLLAAAKRLKKDKPSSSKRKLLNAEETPSGLFIVRAPPQDTSFSASQPLPTASSSRSQPLSRPSSSQPLPSSSSSSRQDANKRSRSTSSTPQPSRSSRPNHYGRAAPSPIPEDPEIESAVQAMNEESNSLSLRRQSTRVPTVMDQNLNPAFHFPTSESHPDGGLVIKKHSKGKGKAKDIVMDISAPVEENETPQILRNKRLREGAMAAITSGREEGGEGNERTGREKERRPNGRRRSSLSRGKRISSGFENTGIITSPHNSVSQHSFYKHIDADLPDSERLRQLLIWCTIRASGTTTFSSSSTPSKPRSLPSSSASSSSNSQQKSLPELSEHASRVLKQVQDDLVRKLAERKIDLSLFGPGTGVQETEGEKLKENEQNSKNKNFEVKYSQEIRRLEQEEDQWRKISYRYEEYSKRFTQSMDRRLSELTAAQNTMAQLSEKARGKQRVIDVMDDDEFEGMLPDAYDLPNDLRRSIDFIRATRLSSTTTAPAQSSSSPGLTTHRGKQITRQTLSEQINALIPEVSYKLDRLHSFVNAARSTARVAEEMLDERFKLLVDNLEKRRLGNGASESSDTGGGMDVVKNYVSKEVPPAHVRDLTPMGMGDTPEPGRGGVGVGGQGGGAGGGGLMDLMRALSRIDSSRHPSKIGDNARRAAREISRIQGDHSSSSSLPTTTSSSTTSHNTTSSNIGGGHGVSFAPGTATTDGMGTTRGRGYAERRLTAVYPPGILSGNHHTSGSGAGMGAGAGAGNGTGNGSAVIMTPRKAPGTPRRYGTPSRERTPGR